MKRPSFLAVKVAQVLCVAYILVLTFSYAPLGLRDPETGNIIDVGSAENTENGVILVNGDFRPVVARGTFEMVCLAMSRMSAFSLYPVLVLAYTSKCKATLNYLEKTPLSMFMNKDEHKLHVYSGKFIAFDVWIHTIFHLLRWTHQGNMELLWTTTAGLSGLIAVVATPLITFVMMYFKNIIPYEIRKGLHYLFYLFAIGLCFHVPPSGIPNGGFIAYVLGFSIILYSLDCLYVIFFMTERVDTSKFQVLPSCVQMKVAVSDRFQRCGEKGGFGYVCLPWVDRQWHAFSLFQDPSDPAQRAVFILDVGNWTNAVCNELKRNNTSRPVWIQGPFASPYKTARDFDNQILVSTGIGITPALSVIEAHKESRTIFLVWSTRDAHLIEFFLKNYQYLDHKFGFNYIHYTGQTPLNPILLKDLPSNVKIICSRPNLDVIIPNIIHAHESSERNQHKKFRSCSKCQVIQGMLAKSAEFDIEMPMASPLANEEKLHELRYMVQEAGYDFKDISQHFREAGIICPFTGAKATKGSSSQIVPMASDSTPSAVLERLRKHADLWEPTLHAARSIKKMEHKDSVLSRWGVMYCGGSSSVKGILKKVSKEYDVDLHCESFAW